THTVDRECPEYYSSATVWCSIDKCSREERERERFERDHTPRIYHKKKKLPREKRTQVLCTFFVEGYYSQSSSLPCRGPLCVFVVVVAVVFAATLGVAATAPAAKPVQSTEHQRARACVLFAITSHSKLFLRQMLLLILHEGRLRSAFLFAGGSGRRSHRHRRIN
ncbi:unnamed protein product, partial [Ectocarpus sp. 4 AP-2014]